MNIGLKNFLCVKKCIDMRKSEFKYFLIVMSFMVFGSIGIAKAQETTETGAEVTYDNMFNNVEETEEHDVLTLAAMEENLSTFVRLVKESGLERSIELAGPVTILAPTNEAFQEMSRERFEELTDPANRQMLQRVIQAHILPSKVYMRDFEENQILETSEGESIPVETVGHVTAAGEPASVVIGGASIVKPNVEGTNGIIHVVDDIIIPEETRDTTIGGY